MHVEGIIKVTLPAKLYIHVVVVVVVVAFHLFSITVQTSVVCAALFVVSSLLMVPVTVSPFACCLCLIW